ncbi:hypothetical protein ASD12_26795 [Mesorhizobium sp. Root102]|nr:hypothetical protein ASD12_26795 [Mesorhizobium sp. Root102]
MSANQNQRQTMAGLQALRFLAAFGVFAHHAVAYAQMHHVIPEGSLAVARYGASGVAVFFALSGYLMAMLSAKATPGEFILRRALRIYPGFWLAVAITIPMRLILIGSLQRSYDWPGALLLYPAGKIPYLLAVEWTLVFEIFFYVVVALLCFVPSIAARQLLVAAWGLIILCFGHWSQQGGVIEIALSQINLAFIFGMFAYWYRDYIEYRGVPAFLAAVALLALCRSHLGLAWLPFQIGIGISATLMVLAATRATMFAEHGLLKRAGDASYGFYLIHAQFVSTFFMLVNRPSWTMFILISGVSLGLSIAYGVWEASIHRKIINLWRTRPAVRFADQAA